MDTNNNTTQIPLVKSGDKLGAGYFNKIANSVNKLKGSTAPAFQVVKQSSNADKANSFSSARLLLRDAAYSLSGTSTAIGGVSLSVGYYVLRVTDNSDNKDGLYCVQSSTWTILAAVNASCAFSGYTSSTYIYPHGSIISIWDGGSFPNAAIVGTTGATTF